MELFPDFTIFSSDSIFTLLFWGFALIQLFWLLFFYIRVATHKDKVNPSQPPPVSIIIVTRNEEEHLSELLPSVLEQNYHEFEVVVVNHQSIDNTESLLKALKEKYSRLRVVNIERNNHLTFGKKLPLTIGIKGAKYEHVLLTDADCKPATSQWLKLMASQFTPQKKIVLGYAPYHKTPSFLNRVIRIDTAFSAIKYFSFAKAGVPFKGSGKNLGYTKELFLENKGFKSHYHIAAGDDDLFIQEVAKDKNYAISLSPKTFCYSNAKDKWPEWLSQKATSHATYGKYTLFNKVLLGIYPISLFLLFISLFTLIINNWMCWTSIIVISFLLISKWLILGLGFKRLNQKTLVWGILFWDLFYVLLMPVIYYTSEQSKTKWK